MVPIEPDLDPGEQTDAAAAAVSRRAAPGRRVEASVLAAIALGGALGGPARYGIAQVVHVAPGGMPWATLVTNVSGSFVIGLVLALVLERFPPTRYLRPFVATGFLGAYTTYSTFAVETAVLVKDGHVPVALAYVVASLVAGLAAARAGLWAGRSLPLPHRGGAR